MPIARYAHVWLGALIVWGGAAAPQAIASEALAAARQSYNAGHYGASATSARLAMEDPRSAQEARVVLGRALVEVYRISGDAADLAAAREALATAASGSLTPVLRVEWLVGVAAALYFEEAFGASAETFASILEDPRAETATPGGRERLIDWWATAHDRSLQRLEGAARQEAYERFAERLRDELRREPALGVPVYWLVIAARGAGDLETAWSASRAAWVRALIAPDHGAALRADLERVMRQAIIPERARRLGPDTEKQAELLTAQWEEFKSRWAVSSR